MKNREANMKNTMATKLLTRMTPNGNTMELWREKELCSNGTFTGRGKTLRLWASCNGETRELSTKGPLNWFDAMNKAGW